MAEGEDTIDAREVIEGREGFDYLGRSIAIVTLLYERGILQELIDSGRIDPAEIDSRLELIKKKYPMFDKNSLEQEENDSGKEE